MRWFKHFSDASSDYKILSLEDKYGPLGYCFYWKTVEFIAGHWSGFGDPEVETTFSHYRKLLRTQIPKIKLILEDMRVVGLLDYKIDQNKLIIRIDALKKIRDNSSQKNIDNRGITRELKEYIVRRDNKQCQYCLETLSGKSLNFDHFIPYSLGGKSDASNIVLSCNKCNKIKSIHHPDDIENGHFSFSKMIGEIRTKLSLEVDKDKDKDKDKEIELEYKESKDSFSTVAENHPPVAKAKSKEIVLIKNEVDFLDKIPEKTKARWLELYPDQVFLKREVLKAMNWCDINKNKTPKTIAGWSRFFGSWFERGWVKHVKTIQSVQPTGFSVDQMKEILGENR